jgi:cytochrome c biogenesis protein CcmG, thiol:disulfide interchange protein DsbE
MGRATRNWAAMMVVGVVTVGAAGGAMTATACVPPAKDAHPLARKSVPEVELKLQKGGSWRPADANGKVLIVDFWASWCEPCRDSFPKLDAIYKRHENGGLVVVAINEDEEPTKIPNFLQSTGVTFPVALDPSGSAASSFGVSKMPSQFVVDRRGVVRFVHSGYQPDEMEALEDEIKQLLREEP